MVSFKDRKTLRQGLVASGYSWEYLDEWQPKTTLYRHAPGLNTAGEVSQPVGSEVRGVPGNPDYVVPKARIGWFPYPPNNSCTCRWCAERAVEPEDLKEIPDKYKCDKLDCDYVATSATHSGRVAGLMMHTRNNH